MVTFTYKTIIAGLVATSVGAGVGAAGYATVNHYVSGEVHLEPKANERLASIDNSLKKMEMAKEADAQKEADMKRQALVRRCKFFKGLPAYEEQCKGIEF